MRPASGRFGSKNISQPLVHLSFFREIDVMRNVSPTSGSEPPREDTTGHPQAIASNTGRPNPSCNDGKTNAWACEYRARISRCCRRCAELNTARRRRLGFGCGLGTGGQRQDGQAGQRQTDTHGGLLSDETASIVHIRHENTSFMWAAHPRSITGW